MLQSMTGFASSAVAIMLDDGTRVDASLSIKSLNYRHFEVLCKMPHTLSALETLIIKRCRERLSRGHVYVTVYLSDPNAFKTHVEPSMNTIEGYLKAIEQVKNHFNLSGDFTIHDLVRLPNVFSASERELDEGARQQLMAAVDDVLDALVREREREGEALRVDVRERIRVMNQAIHEVERIFIAAMDERKREVAERLSVLSTEIQGSASDERGSLYAELDKMDIHEEIVRLTTHLHNLDSLLDSTQQEIGKQLDFTLQELTREINTIAAKANSVAISSRAITIKVELEKAREQAQNIV
jgi:uncharacterized protein (TIGR00255 family)